MLAIAACAPYDPYGSSPTVQTEAGGYSMIVQKDPRGGDAYSATIDHTRQLVSLGYDPLTRRRVSIEAIENVSGCSVVPETVVLQDRSRAVFAEVDC